MVGSCTPENEVVMVIENATLLIIEGKEQEFEAAYKKAKSALTSAKGCRSARLIRCVEQPNLYRLIVEWDTIENHMVDYQNGPSKAGFGGVVSPFIAARQQMFHFTAID
jgi:heme-degrading monooxygenase HmoA